MSEQERFYFPDVKAGEAARLQGVAFLEANGIDAKTVCMGSTMMVGDGSITVTQFRKSEHPAAARDLCECNCGCSAVGESFITHGFKTDAVTYPLVAHPSEFGWSSRWLSV